MSKVENKKKFAAAIRAAIKRHNRVIKSFGILVASKIFSKQKNASVEMDGTDIFLE